MFFIGCSCKFSNQGEILKNKYIYRDPEGNGKIWILTNHFKLLSIRIP